MPKNLVICCDGTGNEIGANISNVLKLYRVLSKNSLDQVVFYDPGVGTLARPDPWKKLLQDVKTILGLATGYGIDDGVLAAYEFLVDQYEDGDDIYLFGFSRGAYTVRVLAGFVHMVGLLRSQQRNLAGSALTAYKQTRATIAEQPGQSADNVSWQFARIVSARWPKIKFVGVWDTVASVLVPRPDRFYLPTPQKLPCTARNPSVQVFRQAMAFDERRRMFRLHGWDDPQEFIPNRFNKSAEIPPRQDVKQVWFAGVHSDIGGGYPETKSGLSKFPLLWMIDEAVQHGLKVSTQNVNQLAWGNQRRGSPFSYVAPDATCEPNESMTAVWRVLEWVPKAVRYREWPARRAMFGLFFPAGEPRPIPQNSLVHESVFQRMDQARFPYHPINLEFPREHYQIVPTMPPPNPPMRE